MNSEKTSPQKTVTKSTGRSAPEKSKTTVKKKDPVPNDITKAAIMILNNTEDYTFVRTGGTAIVDLGVDNPIEAWTGGNYSQAASKIKKELGLPELKGKYVKMANSLQSLGLAHKLTTTLADTLIQVSTLNAFFEDI